MRDDCNAGGRNGCVARMPYDIASPVRSAMGRHHLVRVGALGHVGRFTAVDAVRYPRDARVVVRTGRGLEVGEVLAPPSDGPDEANGDGSILRGMTTEDQLLGPGWNAIARPPTRPVPRGWPRLRLAGRADGRRASVRRPSLVFYFLGEISEELAAITDELAELYETHVQFRRFAEAVTEGCGPGCGTETAAGCKTCVTGCAVASACTTRAHAG